MNERQKAFCLEYTKDLNATKSAIRAGYSKKTAGQQGFELLRKLEIQNQIQAFINDRAARVKIDSDYVLTRLSQIDNLDIIDILDDDLCALPICDWPKEWRTSVSAIDIAEVKVGDSVETVVKKIKLPDKLKALEMIGRHVSVNAFQKDDSADDKEAVPVNIQIGVVDGSAKS